MVMQDIDKVAKVVVTHQNKLLILRKNNKVWELPGGHLQQGEKYSQGAKRETFEETSIVMKKMRKLTKRKDYRLYGCRFLNKPNIVLSDEHTDHVWVAISDLRKYNLHPKFKQDQKFILDFVKRV